MTTHMHHSLQHIQHVCTNTRFMTMKSCLSSQKLEIIGFDVSASILFLNFILFKLVASKYACPRFLCIVWCYVCTLIAFMRVSHGILPNLTYMKLFCFVSSMDVYLKHDGIRYVVEYRNLANVKSLLGDTVLDNVI